MIPLVKNNDSAGPMGRSVKDVPTLLGVIDTQDTELFHGPGRESVDRRGCRIPQERRSRPEAE